jgi:hypothetical protein
MNAARVIGLILTFGLLCTSCGIDRDRGDQRAWTGSVEVSNGVTVVRNPAEPLLGQFTLELQEGMVVGDTIHEESFFFNLIHAAVDGAGKLFIWDPNSFRIQVFDADGAFLRTVGRQGRGPGEFSEAFGTRFRVSPGGELAVLDGGRVQFFDPSGAYERGVQLPPVSSDFVVLAGDDMLLEQMNSVADGPVETVVLVDEEGEPGATLASYRSEKWQGAFIRRLRFTHLAPVLVLAPWGDDGGAFGYPSAYRFTLVGGEGRVVRVVEVDEPPLEVDSELERALIEDMSSDAPRMSPRDLEEEVYIPETWPFYDALFSDEVGNVLVQRSEPLPEPDADRQLDFFTAEGLYLYRLRVSADDIQAVRSGFLYARRFNRDINVSQLVRYRILNWDAIIGTAGQYRLPPAITESRGQ